MSLVVPELECKSRKSVHESANKVPRRGMISRRSVTCELWWECNLAMACTASAAARAQRGRDTGAGYDNDSRLALLQPLSGSERAGSVCPLSVSSWVPVPEYLRDRYPVTATPPHAAENDCNIQTVGN